MDRSSIESTVGVSVYIDNALRERRLIVTLASVSVLERSFVSSHESLTLIHVGVSARMTRHRVSLLLFTVSVTVDVCALGESTAQLVKPSATSHVDVFACHDVIVQVHKNSMKKHVSVPVQQ